MTKASRITRWCLAIGVAVAFGGISSDGRASSGSVTIWLNDITNSVGSASFCESVSNDKNGDGNGNNGGSTVTNDRNEDGNGNAGRGSRQVCLFGTGPSGGSGK